MEAAIPDTQERGTAAPESVDHVSPYLASDRWDELLILDENGMPPLYFTRNDGALWLAENTTGLLVNVANQKLRGLGIWSCRVRGDNHAPGTLGLGDVELVRESNNPHDPHAVGIHQRGKPAGYFNKGMATSLSKFLDRGDALEAMAISVSPPKVVAASPGIMEHLKRLMKS